ncbi:MAG: SMC-Scp complex subunit ScpB [Candidatus Cloacimonetes bacterium]|nr:SMC-Scp complex subunit ScpB [Candidatus Cloacimonadota bacterium]MBS3767541.1 SMC-Scp complex subunit ScpB [Candidatus Cloacimonadota bacterium]
MDKELLNKIEVLIFSAAKPISVSELSQKLDIADHSLIQKAIDKIDKELRQTGRPFCLRKVAGGYTYASRKKYYQFIKNLFKDTKTIKLTPAVTEVLAIIAYHQPLTRAKVNDIRGVNCDYHIRNLLEVDLIKIAGRLDTLGKPMLYETTQKFLKFFGLNSIEDLPNLHEIREIMEEDVSSPQEMKGQKEEEIQEKLLE